MSAEAVEGFQVLLGMKRDFSTVGVSVSVSASALRPFERREIWECERIVLDRFVTYFDWSSCLRFFLPSFLSLV